MNFDTLESVSSEGKFFFLNVLYRSCAGGNSKQSFKPISLVSCVSSKKKVWVSFNLYIYIYIYTQGGRGRELL